MDSEKHSKKQGANLVPYHWKKGQSGNPAGRPKGKTLKEFAREYLEKLPDDEKVDFLASLPTEIVWKMAEGNPKQDTDMTSGGNPIIIVPAAVAETFNINETNPETGESDSGQV